VIGSAGVLLDVAVFCVGFFFLYWGGLTVVLACKDLSSLTDGLVSRS
jgi:hypothetical protein